MDLVGHFLTILSPKMRHVELALQRARNRPFLRPGPTSLLWKNLICLSLSPTEVCLDRMADLEKLFSL